MAFRTRSGRDDLTLLHLDFIEMHSSAAQRLRSRARGYAYRCLTRCDLSRSQPEYIS
jgi:hypothetical protein